MTATYQIYQVFNAMCEKLGLSGLDVSEFLDELIAAQTTQHGMWCILAIITTVIFCWAFKKSVEDDLIELSCILFIIIIPDGIFGLYNLVQFMSWLSSPTIKAMEYIQRFW